ncbi:hypothetical protein [Aurantibacter sp.]|uniref:hypothetical protein n=1 Tax=Aurantibacter sp. TaxID=2807103 RepID=UPI0032676C05
MALLTNKHIFIITFLVAIHCNSQELIGKWYMQNSTGLLETEITKDSITFNEMSSSFNTTTNEGKTGIKILKKVKQAKKTLFIYQYEDDKSEFQTLVFTPFQKNEIIKFIWNGIETAESINMLVKSNKNNSSTLYGYNLYSKEYIDELKKRKSVESMTLQDFIKYLSVYFEKLKTQDSETIKLRRSYLGASHYKMDIISQTLLELEYNPIHNIIIIENLYQKYIQEPEVQTFLDDLEKGLK